MIIRLIVLLILVWALSRRRRPSMPKTATVTEPRDNPLENKPDDERTRFSYVNASAKEVFLAGEFNHWSSTATPMRNDEYGKWSIGLPLPPGKYQYKFVADGKWLYDSANPDAVPDGMGGKNSVLTLSR
jgi:1,4-alpha-glucan branching enzyme